MEIPVFDNKRQNKTIRKELMNAISSVLDSGVYILGKRVEEFEGAFAEYLGVKYAVGVASGTDAIRLALLSLGIEKGDEVIMPANSYPSVFGVADSGAIPRLVDIEPATCNINPDLIEKAITKRTKAIMPVHLYGQPADMERIFEIEKKYGLPVIEDCAQAAGGEIRSQKSEARSQKCGSIGDIGCFSFYPTKNLGAFGDGGMVVTNNKEIYKRVKLLRMYGEDRRYHSILAGKNSRLDEMQAAILLVKLKHLDEWNEMRRKIAEQYNQAFAHMLNFLAPQLATGFTSNQYPYLLSRLSDGKSLRTELEMRSSKIPHISLFKHIYHLYVIRTKKRDELKEYLTRQGIGTGIHYPVPIHLTPSMKFLGYRKGVFPESEKACNEVLSLPMWPELTEKEVRYIAEKVSGFLMQNNAKRN